jgi:hypothetical protein
MAVVFIRYPLLFYNRHYANHGALREGLWKASGKQFPDPCQMVARQPESSVGTLHDGAAGNGAVTHEQGNTRVLKAAS